MNVGVPGRINSQDGVKIQDREHEDLQHDKLHDITMESYWHGGQSFVSV